MYVYIYILLYIYEYVNDGMSIRAMTGFSKPLELQKLPLKEGSQSSGTCTKVGYLILAGRWEIPVEVLQDGDNPGILMEHVANLIGRVDGDDSGILLQNYE